MPDPCTRPFTQLAAEIAFGKAGTTALNKRRCPSCKSPIGGFRNPLSQREFEISGLCQSCQDSVFGKD